MKKFKKGDRVISDLRGYRGFIDDIISFKSNPYKVYWTSDKDGDPIFYEGAVYLSANQINIDPQWYREQRLKKLLKK
ncbi:MAG: hypothetical protein SLAVMIC_00992 [uncultured marine phage]|uniref:Uncharacterized protein n=1 Tax=uncultured marine phage TaxID=707152 RepID=A0A8D9C9W0_9VIRU|nr:MAG: hypothetical protein SLAVMIC_00992 [uncultured marine phage]